MKRFLLILTVLLTSILFTGCATTSHLTVANSATISQANFRLVRPVSRSFKATYFLGLGGAKKEIALRRVIFEMNENLGPNQALAYINVVESSKVPIIPIIFTQSTLVSAMVIEYY